MSAPDAAEPVSDAVLRAIAARAGLPDAATAPIEPVPNPGAVNRAWYVGGYVVRIPHDKPDCLAETAAERIAVPVALARGIRTPRLVLYDEARDLVPVPYTVYERATGVPLGTLPVDHAAQPAIWEAVGFELATLHGARVPEGLPGETFMDADARLSRAAEVGALRPAQVDFFRRWLEHLAPARISGPIVLLHDDAHPMNLLVDQGRLTALIDWGDAGIGEAAIEFASVPLRACADALRGYRAVRPLDPAAESRILRAHIGIALHLLGPDREEGWPGPGVRLTELLRFVAEGMAPGFERWAPPRS